MLNSQVANLVNYFYPLGNTPAVSLTQDLPPGKRADILLLGCGDLRHVLFTTQTDGKHSDVFEFMFGSLLSVARLLDITACDVEEAVIARNILLLTLLVDGIEDPELELYWNLYYHFRIDKQSAALLQLQARKLCSLSTSLQKWRECDYGRLIKFCDSVSFTKARQMWTFYAAQSKSAGNLQICKDAESAIQAATRCRNDRVGTGVSLTGIRSCLPTLSNSIRDIDTIQKHYWKHGFINLNPAHFSSTTFANPMFVSLHDNAVLHYGTDPTLGFHLATAYAPLLPGSPLHQKLKGKTSPETLVAAVKAEFKAWATTFNKQWRRVTLRHFVGDALTFAYSIRHAGETSDTQAPKILYRDHFHLEPLVLDGERSAPIKFTVIDTSNLLDHLGPLNLLVATSPLLADDSSATLHTEKLVRSDASHLDMLDNLLCGPLSSMSMLLNVTLVDLAMNTSSIGPSETALEGVVTALNKGDGDSGQRFLRLTWKRPARSVSKGAIIASEIIIFNPVELSRILYQVYLKMFEGENILSLMANITFFKMKQLSLPAYNRASFAILLSHLKSKITVDWQRTATSLLSLIETNKSHRLTFNFIQELYTWFHLLGILSVDILRLPVDHGRGAANISDLQGWKNIPAIVSVTLVVPRSKIAVLTKRDITKTGTPALQCIVDGSSDGKPWQNIFGAIQIGFGKLTSRGDYHNDTFELDVAEGDSGWYGKSPLVVSFYAPAWTLTQRSESMSVSFGIQTTPQSVKAFVQTLGIKLVIYATNLTDENHVFISRYRPNLSGTFKPQWPAANDEVTLPAENFEVKSILTAAVAPHETGISSWTGHTDLMSADSKKALQAGGAVSVTVQTPFNMTVAIGPSLKFNVNFPMAVVGSNMKTRIARKSSYIEVVCQAANSTDWSANELAVYPVLEEGDGLALWNLPYLNLDSLPKLDTTQSRDIEWLTTHTSLMFTAKERAVREQRLSKPLAGEQCRLDFKDSLFSMFMHYSGLQGSQTHLFGINCPTAGGIHILIFVSSLRLDLSNRSVVLDTAVLPLYYALMPRVMPALDALRRSGKLCQINTTEAEMQTWKQALPAYIECCRTWPHKSSCQYLKDHKIPLSVIKGDRCICSCAEGVLPSDFVAKTTGWKDLARYAVRAAITPCFGSAMNATMFDLQNSVEGAAKDVTASCRNCGKVKKIDGSELMTCSRCHQAKYCSRDCQRADWTKHKTSCKAE